MIAHKLLHKRRAQTYKSFDSLGGEPAPTAPTRVDTHKKILEEENYHMRQALKQAAAQLEQAAKLTRDQRFSRYAKDAELAATPRTMDQIIKLGR